jgi:DivIVA domain-containing protein
VTSTPVHGYKFRKAVRGYAMREVDAFIGRVADTLERLKWAHKSLEIGFPAPDLPPYVLTPDDVEEVEFHRATGGYDYNEVDAFLDQVQRRIARFYMELSAAPYRRPRPVVGRLRLPLDHASLGFAVCLRGYAAADVDAFLKRAASTLDRLEAARSAREHGYEAPGLPPNLLTADDVRHVSFPEVHPGYDVQEVDELLDEIERTIAHYHHELRIEF